MVELKKLGLKIASLYRRGYFEAGHTELGKFIDIIMDALQKNHINELINVTKGNDLFVHLEDINESFSRGDFIRIADIIEYEIPFKTKNNLVHTKL